MTILVAVNTVLTGAVMLADTRLANPTATGDVLLHDACQKMVAATPGAWWQSRARSVRRAIS